MNKPIIIDIFRTIKKTFGRFFSIFAIVMIGVAFFTGVKSSAPVMEKTADKYFKDNNLMDMHVTSSNGLSDEDVSLIKGIEGVKAVYPTHTIDVISNIAAKERVIRIHPIPIDNLKDTNDSYINKATLVEGRYPENSGECLLEYNSLDGLKIKVGEKINLESGTDIDLKSLMNTKQYAVVGTAIMPEYLSFDRGDSKLGDGVVSSFIMVPESDFKMPLYTDILIKVNGTESINSFDDEYINITNNIKTKLEDLGRTRGQLNYDKLKADGNSKIEQAKAYCDALRKYNSPELKSQEEKLNQLENEVSNLQIPKWYVLDRTTITSLADYKSSANKMEAISKIFPIFFLLVSVLVCLTTMARMVDEERGNIGILKALGYSKFSIAIKYVVYAALASTLGCIAGLLIGLPLFPTVIFNAWGLMFTMPKVQLIFPINLAIIATVFSIVVTTAVTVFACYNDLVESPALIMRPKPPKNGKRILLERVGLIWNILPFTMKVTARNLIRYKKRFFMTVIGIAGCTALLVTGFGIRDSIKTAAYTQFNEIQKLNVNVILKDNLTTERKDSLYNKYQNDARVTSFEKIIQINSVAQSSNKNISAIITVPIDNKQFEDYVSLRERVTKAKLELSDNGVILNEKLAKDLNLSIGDKFNVKNKNGDFIEVEVGSITENYIGNYIYMSKNYYETVFGVSYEYNSIFAKLKDTNNDIQGSFASELLQDGSIATIKFYSNIITKFDKILFSLKYIVIVIIISAGALAFVVLYNLTNVNISERLREIATIKVLGYYNREVSSYVYRENIILVVIGTAVGSALGKALHLYIMSTMDIDIIMFGREVNMNSYIYSVLLTFGFAFIVNFAMYFKLRKIKMAESLKSVE